MRASLVVALFAVLGLAGCTGDNPSPSASSSSDPVVEAACPAIVLRTPSGAHVNLTGRWRSPDGGTYYLRQSASCVWFMGLSGDIGALHGESVTGWTNSFFGHLAIDFTLSGSWADVPWGPADGVGALKWQVVFGPVNGKEATTIEVIEGTGGFDRFDPGFLVRPETEANLRGRLKDTAQCAALVADDGETYELVVLPDRWEFAQTPGRLYGPDDMEVNVGDPFEVSGEVARGNGSCGLGLLFFADTITGSAAP